MKRLSAVLLIGILVLSLNLSSAIAAAKPGTTCKKLGQISMSGQIKYTCVKIGKRLIWDKGMKVVTKTPKVIPIDAIAIRIDSILRTSTGINGVFLKEIDHQIISDYQSKYVFEPASSIKVLVALYIFDLVKMGQIKLNGQFPTITSANPHGCPTTKTNGTESFQSAIEQMMQISDNDRTNALIMYFGVAKINAFAKTIGLTNTKLATSLTPPGFNFIGCVIPSNVTDNPVTVSGNTSTLQDLTKIWELANALPSPYREDFMKITAGREMFNSAGYDFSGIWPALTQIVKEETPTNLSSNSITKFTDEMRSNTKGGSAAVCFRTANCTTVRWWVSMVSLTKIPICLPDKSVAAKSFVWGYFNSGADSTSVELDAQNLATAGFLKVGAEPMREQIRDALRSWAPCST